MHACVRACVHSALSLPACIAWRRVRHGRTLAASGYSAEPAATAWVVACSVCAVSASLVDQAGAAVHNGGLTAPQDDGQPLEPGGATPLSSDEQHRLLQVGIKGRNGEPAAGGRRGRERRC